MAIEVKEVPVEVYNSIKKIKQYHTPLRYIYKIIFLELEDINKEFTLQMAVKAINDSTGLDGLIPILLVFSAYL